VSESTPETTFPYRIALGIDYDGAAFHGWQRQGDPQLPTVQGALEKALSALLPTRSH